MGATINLRAGPGTDYPVVGQAQQNDALAVIGRDIPTGWFQVVASDGLEGWVEGSLVEVSHEELVAQVEAPPPPPPPSPIPKPTEVPAQRAMCDALPDQARIVIVGGSSGELTFFGITVPPFNEVIGFDISPGFYSEPTISDGGRIIPGPECGELEPGETCLVGISPDAVVGGVVRPSLEHPESWALFFCDEYESQN